MQRIEHLETAGTRQASQRRRSLRDTGSSRPAAPGSCRAGHQRANERRERFRPAAGERGQLDRFDLGRARRLRVVLGDGIERTEAERPKMRAPKTHLCPGNEHVSAGLGGRARSTRHDPLTVPSKAVPIEEMS